MAQTPYAGGVADVQPDTRAPDDYQRVQATPGAFGAAIAKGGEELGKGGVDLSKYWGHIQANDASNKAQQEAQDFMLGIKQLEGQDALNAQAGAKEKLQAIYDKHLADMATGDQIEVYQNENRPFFNRYIMGEMNTHFATQGKVVADNIVKSGVDNAHQMAATAGASGDWPTVGVSEAIAGKKLLQGTQNRGMERDPQARQQAATAAGAVWITAIEARAATNPDDAWAKLQDPKVQAAIPPDKLPELQTKVQAEVSKFYASKADALEAAGDYEGARDLIVGHEKQFGNYYGPALLKNREGLKNQTADDNLKKANADVAGGYGTAPGGPPLNATFSKYNGLLSGGDVQGALRLSEGLRTDAYWDVNHWRTGYGSDTVTRADGTVEQVTQNTKITPADAERDLQRRTAIAANTAAVVVGPVWGGMSPGAKSALTSVVYNYGHVPNDIAEAARSGNMAALSQALMKHSTDNDGINAQRRMAEARAVIGGNSSPSGPISLADYKPGEEAPPTAPTSSTDTMFHPDEKVAPPPAAPLDPTVAVYDHYAKVIQWADEHSADLEDAQLLKKKATEEVQLALGAIGAAEQEKKAKADAARDDVLGVADSNTPTSVRDAFAKLDQYRKIGAISQEQRDTIREQIAKRTGEPDPISLGPKFNELRARVAADPNDPNRLADLMELGREEVAGNITKAGYNLLKERMADVRKSVDEAGMQRSLATASDYAKRHLVHEPGDPLLKGTLDQKGLDIWEMQFQPQFEQQYRDWKKAREVGKGDDTFPLLDPKNMDAFIETLYPERLRRLDRMRSEPMVAEPAGTVPPAPPAGYSAEGWNTLMQAAPKLKTGGVNHAIWAEHVQELVDNPKEMAPLWDASELGKVLPAAKVLQTLGVQAPAGEAIPQPYRAGGREMTPSEAQTTKTNDEDKKFDEWLQSVPPWVMKKLGIQIGDFNRSAALNPEFERDLKAAKGEK